jgi:hypothetical protein
LGFLIAVMSSMISFKLAPIENKFVRIIYGLPYFTFMIVLLIFWALWCAGRHGDSI